MLYLKNYSFYSFKQFSNIANGNDKLNSEYLILDKLLTEKSFLGLQILRIKKTRNLKK